MPLEPLKRKKYLRRAMLALTVFLFAMAQNVPWFPVIYGASALPLIPLVVAIAVLDQEAAAVLFGAMAGVLWDVTSLSRGWHAIYLTVAAFACAMLMRYILNRNLLTVLLLNLAAAALYLIPRWMAEYPRNDPMLVPMLLRHSLPTLAYTLLLSPLIYLLVRRIVRSTSRRQGGVLAE
ncbi:MAG: hypothetical protein FWH26_02295 [Oscillospiraceae bacterium]|nr:hypothetical protein [Oscillospiraceae bacterium]